ncbi:uncharacterized protein LOC131526918 [Onychostoma macrolepis]|uniref:uncharacterized protein LOC131526918 n=1 Tax=Onychostoma macrolepis TaxID=369639 RepID=UPI00272BB070|nr:uncharacterized protein LOC131526918 [Onychostoma macrolepis]
MESSGPSTAAPEFDVYGAMDWKDGVGTLPGSELKTAAADRAALPWTQDLSQSTIPRPRNRRRESTHGTEVRAPPPTTSSDMDELLKHLTEVSIRQQQIAEHLAARQGQTEQEIAALRAANPPVSPSDAAQHFHEWEYKAQLPARAQAAELTRLARHWLLEGDPSATQVIVVDRFLRALPRSHRRAVGMRNLTSTSELVELADATQQRDVAERAPPFPRRVSQERRAPEGTPRHMSRPAARSVRDEPMPTERPAQTWLAGCSMHRDLPAGAPEDQGEGEWKIVPGPSRLGKRSKPHPGACPSPSHGVQDGTAHNLCPRGHSSGSSLSGDHLGCPRHLARRSGRIEGSPRTRPDRLRLARI